MKWLAFMTLFGGHASYDVEKVWTVDSSTVHRIYDEETGVACYVVPTDRCAGPAISCVKVSGK